MSTLIVDVDGLTDAKRRAAFAAIVQHGASVEIEYTAPKDCTIRGECVKGHGRFRLVPSVLADALKPHARVAGFDGAVALVEREGAWLVAGNTKLDRYASPACPTCDGLTKHLDKPTEPILAAPSVIRDLSFAAGLTTRQRHTRKLVAA